VACEPTVYVTSVFALMPFMSALQKYAV